MMNFIPSNLRVSRTEESHSGRTSRTTRTGRWHPRGTGARAPAGPLHDTILVPTAAAREGAQEDRGGRAGRGGRVGLGATAHPLVINLADDLPVSTPTTLGATAPPKSSITPTTT